MTAKEAVVALDPSGSWIGSAITLTNTVAVARETELTDA